MRLAFFLNIIDFDRTLINLKIAFLPSSFYRLARKKMVLLRQQN